MKKLIAISFVLLISHSYASPFSKCDLSGEGLGKEGRNSYITSVDPKDLSVLGGKILDCPEKLTTQLSISFLDPETNDVKKRHFTSIFSLSAREDIGSKKNCIYTSFLPTESLKYKRVFMLECAQ